jgi:CHAT domain-containing protein/tetratricopeptide (TPR) repeat protein
MRQIQCWGLAGTLTLLGLTVPLLPESAWLNGFNAWGQASPSTGKVEKQQVEQTTLEGLDLFSKNRYPEALEKFKQALTVAQQAQDLEVEGLLLHWLGKTSSRLDQYAEGLEYNQQVFEILRKKGTQNNDDRFLEAKTFEIDGVIYQKQAQYPQALKSFHQSLAIFEQLKKSSDQATALNNIGVIHIRLDDYSQALKSFHQALKLREDSQNGTILSNIGEVYRQQGQYHQALAFYQNALENFNQTNAFFNQANTLNNIGAAYSNLSQYDRAEEAYRQALNLFQKLGNRSVAATTLNNLGAVHDDRSEYSQALEFYQQALALFKSLDDSLGVGSTFNNIGLSYQRLGQPSKALDYFQQALTIYRKIGNHSGERAALNNIGAMYGSQSQYSQSLLHYHQSLGIAQKISDRRGEATTLNNIGNIYQLLGQYSKAQKLLQQSFRINREIGNRSGEATTLKNIGGAYSKQKQYPQALKFHQQALAISQEIGDRALEATTFISIGEIYGAQELFSPALKHYQQALGITQDIGDLQTKGLILNNIGQTYRALGEQQKALQSFTQALPLSKAVGDRRGEATILYNIGSLLSSQNQPELAIVFHKQAVNLEELIRSDIQVLPKEDQVSYSQIVASTYRDLADLLLQQDRVLEAQQVLDLLKVQELDDYLNNVRGNYKTAKGISVLKSELIILQKLNESQRSAIQLGQELTQLRQIPAANRNLVQQQRITKLVQLEQELNQNFNQFINSPEVQTALGQLTRTAQRQSVDLSDLDAFRDNLKQLHAVLLSPLILEDRLELVVTTPNSTPMRRTVAVSRQELNQTIVDFRRALQNRRSTDIKPLAQKLYSWLVQPIEADLKQANIETIIYAPDGQLRYIPLSALHDGKQWLIQRLRVNNITAKSFSNLNPQPQAPLNILAGAFVNGEYNFQIGQQNFSFTGLPFAGVEIAQLVATIPGTTQLIDQNFSVDKFQPRMNEHSVVHLATHSAFVPGQPEDSFILFGNGDRATLRDIGSWSLFNVDLVVLSACETGLGGKLGNGEEILGLGYQFQNRGAKATLASLWQVDDGGTQVLMSTFYRQLKAGNISKAEALRQAQVALITGEYSGVGGDRGNINVVNSKTGQPINGKQTLEHPYYWAPFILIGNGL